MNLNMIEIGLVFKELIKLGAKEEICEDIRKEYIKAIMNNKKYVMNWKDIRQKIGLDINDTELVNIFMKVKNYKR